MKNITGKIQSVNPANGTVMKSYDLLSETETIKKIKSAKDEFKSWSETSFRKRGELLKTVAKVLTKKKDEFGRLITLEMGKTLKSAVSEIEKCAWVCNYFAGNAERFLKDKEVKTEAKRSFVTFEPIGTIFAIMPWNFPFWQVFRFAAPAIMAGNTVLLKHASNVPGCSLAIEEVFKEAGFPNGIFQSMLIDSGSAKSVIENPDIAAVTITGSNPAGSSVAETAGKLIKKSVLELGGSDPFIVLEDADLEKTSRFASIARLIVSGQSCIAAKRFIINSRIAEIFIAKLKTHFEKIRLGDPLDPNTDIGPLAKKEILEKIDVQVKQSVRLGAEIVVGGKPEKGKGFFYPPTILTHVCKGMPVYNEETFGPVAPIITVDNDEEAVTIANDTEYGLGASIWTEDERRAIKLSRKIQAGSVFINTIVKSDQRLPFGGIKKSGYGRELSEFGIKEFVNIKTVWVEK